jgi:hypothetical protein
MAAFAFVIFPSSPQARTGARQCSNCAAFSLKEPGQPKVPRCWHGWPRTYNDRGALCSRRLRDGASESCSEASWLVRVPKTSNLTPYAEGGEEGQWRAQRRLIMSHRTASLSKRLYAATLFAEAPPRMRSRGWI